jgi:phosphoribosylamine--glycine ligase
VERICVAPGNAGTADVGTAIPIAATDIPGVVEFAGRERIDLTVVGPEAPLVAGLVDELQRRDLVAFGPTAAAARIEGSKAWSRELCARHGIPAPSYRTFAEPADAIAHLDGLSPPYVVKADGLAGGKGVTVAATRDGAVRAVEDALVGGRFGTAGSRVVIEEHLTGREVSALGLTDGRSVVPLVLAQDFKRAEDDDRGPNTGGMGAYSPVSFVDGETEHSIVKEALEATVQAMAEEGSPYRGVLYAGLMLTDEGPKVLEFNARFGDPETQAVLPRLASDLAPALLASARGDLNGTLLEWRPQACVTVILASGGYPGEHATGLEIRGLDQAASLEDVHVFHAGTALRNGKVVTAGGRVLAVSALGTDLAEARRRAYDAASGISFEGMHLRSDIAKEAARA